ncbi:uncharacterized protein LOC117318523, partial [Pecten maximus]|uniref:uncharacterized protein LOC117318523 n=1 Tax=Pecten maximus TaxID=6579 RepID=UPI001458FAA4
MQLPEKTKTSPKCSLALETNINRDPFESPNRFQIFESESDEELISPVSSPSPPKSQPKPKRRKIVRVSTEEPISPPQTPEPTSPFRPNSNTTSPATQHTQPIPSPEAESECPSNCLPNSGHFMHNNEVLDNLLKNPKPLNSIPVGTKNNVFFVVDNSRNTNKSKSDFPDDRGV